MLSLEVIIMERKHEGHQEHGHSHSIHPTALGVSLGILWGACMAIVTIANMRSGYLSGLFALLQGMYPGYALSWGGALAGLVFGFVDGFVGGWLLAWIYNKMLARLSH